MRVFWTENVLKMEAHNLKLNLGFLKQFRSEIHTSFECFFFANPAGCLQGPH
jgi:hypothetical protein